MQTIAEVYNELTHSEIQEILQFRGHLFDEEYQFSTEKPEYLYLDNYDENSVHFMVRQNGDGPIIAYLRMICTQIKNLPIYKCHSTIPNSEVIGIEVSRLCVHPSYRGNISSSSVLSSLLKEVLRYSFTLSITHWYVTCTIKSYYLLKKLLKIPVQRIGGGHNYSENLVFYPCFIDLTEALAKSYSPVYNKQEGLKLRFLLRRAYKRMKVLGNLTQTQEKMAA